MKCAKVWPFKNAIQSLLSPPTPCYPSSGLEPESCVIVENPLDVVRDLDEDTGLVPPTHRAEDDDPAQVVVTLGLAGQRGASVQTKEAGGLVSLGQLALRTEDVGEVGGVLLGHRQPCGALAGGDDVELGLSQDPV